MTTREMTTLEALHALDENSTAGHEVVQIHIENSVDAASAPGHETDNIEFTVPGQPQGKGRPRAAAHGKFVRMYTPAKTVTYESTVALAASQAMGGRPLMAGPLRVMMHINMTIPKSKSRKWREAAAAGRIHPITKPDADNVVKTVFDAMNGVVWVDDTQVIALDLIKQYSLIPGVLVNVYPVSEVI